MNDLVVHYIQHMSQKALEVCIQRKWAVDWSRRGVYLHLELSEYSETLVALLAGMPLKASRFIESLRGKGSSSPEEEAADVLFVFFSTIGAFRLDVPKMLDFLKTKCEKALAGEIGAGPSEPS